MVRAAAGALLAVVALAGCADPYGQDLPLTTERERVDGELPGVVPARLREAAPDEFPEAATDPRQTLELAGQLQINWTSATAARQFERMAALSVGEARAQLRLIAATTRADRQQQGARSTGRVVAIDIAGGVSRRSAVVVTRERVTSDGLPVSEPVYRVTAATVERRSDRWVLSRWAPRH